MKAAGTPLTNERLRDILVRAAGLRGSLWGRRLGTVPHRCGRRRCLLPQPALPAEPSLAHPPTFGPPVLHPPASSLPAVPHCAGPACPGQPAERRPGVCHPAVGARARQDALGARAACGASSRRRAAEACPGLPLVRPASYTHPRVHAHTRALSSAPLQAKYTEGALTIQGEGSAASIVRPDIFVGPAQYAGARVRRVHVWVWYTAACGICCAALRLLCRRAGCRGARAGAACQPLRCPRAALLIPARLPPSACSGARH